MTLSLSAADQARLEEALRAVLSPLDYADVDAWRRAVCRHLKELLGADMATFMLPAAEGRLPLFSEELPPREINEYPERIESLGRKPSPWEHQVRLAVWNRDQVYHPDREAYLRSAYYREYLVPLRCFDAVGITIALGERAEPGSLAGLLFHHEREAGPRFGARGLSLLRIVHPAFQAGARTHQRLHAERDRLGRTLDALGAALLVVDRAGRVLHQNLALVRLLEAEGEAERLQREMRSLALSTLGLRSGVAGLPERLGAPPVRQVETAAARYRLRASLVGEGVLGGGAATLVSLERRAPEGPNAQTLREHFGLTRAQARVALLLAEGKRDQEIAKALSISPHTARHHAEAVRTKLDVGSRAEVASRILREEL